MLIAIIGENCSGKSTLAEKIKEAIGAEVITGKDYLRLAKSESEATALFKEKLAAAVSGENIIYVITQAEHLAHQSLVDHPQQCQRQCQYHQHQQYSQS